MYWIISGAGAPLTSASSLSPFLIHPQHPSRHSPSSCVKFLQGSAHQHSPPPSALLNSSTPFLSDDFAPPVLRCVGLERSKEAEREEWIWWTEERGTMATLSALLKTWVILQTLCLALAQVVSERGKMRPVLFCSSVGIKAPEKVWRTVDV